MDMCPKHKGKPIEFISIDAKERICAHCALFGEYKTHDIRPEQDVVDEISTRTECLMEMFSMIQTNMGNAPQEEVVNQVYQKFQAKQANLKQQVASKFKEMRAKLKV